MTVNTHHEAIPYGAKRLTQTKQTPFLAVDEKLLRQTFHHVKEVMPRYRLFYAIKTNSHPSIVEAMHSMGAGFEISSEGELDLLIRQGVDPQRIISSNPVKTNPFIQAAFSAGIRDFAFDSAEEAKKLAQSAPGSRVYVRLAVSNEGSQWPLSGKFGVETEQAADLLAYAAERSLVPYGITFHVGSQCIDEMSWDEAISKSRLVWDRVKEKGIDLKMLNIGGGFPIRYIDAVPNVDRISGVIKDSLAHQFPEDPEIFIEPGRSLVGEAGVLVSTVIGKARRNGDNWLYLDVGVFNGLMESVGGIRYSMATERDGPMIKWILAGPSCDGFDVISSDVELPDLEPGDKVYILAAGAYTTVYASRFNGFPIPETYLY